MWRSLSSSLKANSLAFIMVAGLVFAISLATYFIGRGQEQVAWLLVAVVVGIPVALRVAQHRTLFAYAYVFVLGLEFLSPDWGEGVFTIPKLGAGILFIAYVVTSRRHFSFRPLRLFWLALALTGYFIVALFWSDNVTNGLARSSTFILLLVSYLLVVFYCESRTDVYNFLGAFVFYAIVVAVVAVVQFYLQRDSASNLLAEIRASSVAGNPNESAYYISLGLLIILAQRAGRLPGWRWLSVRAQIGVGILFVVAVATTGSRGVLIALIVSILAVLMLLPGRNRRGLVALLLLAGAGLVLIDQILPVLETWNLRVIDPLQTNRDITAGRLTIWEGAITDFAESPLTGYGMGGYRYEGSVTHNTFLWGFLEGGIAGGILWLAVWLAALLILSRVYRAARAGPSLEWQISIVALCGMLTCSAGTGLSGNIETNKLFWCVLALVEVSRILVTPPELSGSRPNCPTRRANWLVACRPSGPAMRVAGVTIVTRHMWWSKQ